MSGLEDISLGVPASHPAEGEEKQFNSDDEYDVFMKGFKGSTAEPVEMTTFSSSRKSSSTTATTSNMLTDPVQSTRGSNHCSRASSAQSSLSASSFVGLNNQGATCYMNSLLQTLFMTPEFRNALFRWKHDSTRDETIKEDCIPYQLQALFVQMAVGKTRSVGTKPLTRTFGWDDSDGYVQNDVNELCRVLFDVCEKCFAGTENMHLIKTLYEGKYFEYLRLKPPSNAVRGQIASFSDLALVIKPFGSETSNGSVQEMLNHFTRPELLDGDNKVMDEKLNEKCEAYKGTQMMRLPYILTLAFKRFEFDFATLQRSKVNERVEFPYVIDMNEWCEAPWKKEWHEVFSEEYRSSSMAMMLVVARRSCKFQALQYGSHVVQNILSMTHRAWFDKKKKETAANLDEGDGHDDGSSNDSSSSNSSSKKKESEEEEEEEKMEEERRKKEEEEDELPPPLVDYFGNVRSTKKDKRMKNKKEEE